MTMNCLQYVKVHFDSLSEKERKSIFYQSTRALAHMHKNGLMHRDIKLDNILVEIGEDCRTIEELKLADFGMACTVD